MVRVKNAGSREQIVSALTWLGFVICGSRVKRPIFFPGVAAVGGRQAEK